MSQTLKRGTCTFPLRFSGRFSMGWHSFTVLTLLAALLLSLTFASTPASAKRWAVLVSGSSGYYNYRHVADTCHAYNLLIKAGVHPDRIIHLAVDDAARHIANPFPGQLFNRPTAGEDDDDRGVYEGCRIDYRGEKVTTNTLLAVLRGDSAAVEGGKVLRSTERDNVFIFYSDHGSTGVLAMPTGEYLTASKFHNALRLMKDRKMYNKMVIYVEACNSGSMFHEILPNNANIYAVTAANPDESSWGTYCPPNDIVKGKPVGTCLGDEFSVNWMESTESLGMKQTLDEQFRVVRNLTELSHVTRYGDKGLWSNPIAEFMADSSSWSGVRIRNHHRHSDSIQLTNSKPHSQVGKVNSRDIPLNDAMWRYLRAVDTRDRMETAAELVSQINSRVAQDLRYQSLARLLGHAGDTDVEELMKQPVASRVLLSRCFDTAIDRVYRRCGGFTDYSLRYARLLAQLCARHTPDRVMEALEEVCRESPYMPMVSSKWNAK